MESIPETPVLKFHSDTLVCLRSLYDLEKSGRIDDAINILVEWLKKQEHFRKKDFSREYLERAIIIAKGSVEKAKVKLDKVCTFKTLLSIFYEPFDIKNSYLTNNLTSAILPNLTKDHYRVYFFKNWGQQVDTGFLNYYRYALMICEYIQKHDYCNGVVLVFDLNDVNLMELVRNMDVVELRQALTIVMEGYGMRIKSIHILSASKAVDMVVAVFKQALSAKVAERIRVHKEIDTLYSVIPKENLPSEYGGKEKSFIKLCDDLMEELTCNEFLDYFNVMKNACTDENLRKQESFVNQYMGMPGSFRKLNVD